MRTDNRFPAEVHVDRPILAWEEDFKEHLRALLQTHHVLILRGLEMQPNQQVTLTSVFGEVATPWDQHRAHPDTPLVQIVSNAGHKGNSYKSVTLTWHSDESFRIQPTGFTILHALRIPSLGGKTLFADLHAAYKDYPTNARQSLECLRAIHSFGLVMGRILATRVSPEAARAEEDRFPDVRHPLVRIIPGSKQKTFFLNQMCISRIEGLTESESAGLLASLYAHCLQAKYVYSHQWSVRDTLIWDNACVLHRAEDIPVNESRVFNRTITRGPVPQAIDQ